MRASLPGTPGDEGGDISIFFLLHFLTRVEVLAVAKDNEHSEQWKRLVDLCNAIRGKIHALDSEHLHDEIDGKIIDFIGIDDLRRHKMKSRYTPNESPDYIEDFLGELARLLEDIEPG